MDLPNLLSLHDDPHSPVIISMITGAGTCPATERRQLRQRARSIVLKRAQSALRLPHIEVSKTALGAPVWPNDQRGSFSHWNNISLCLLCASDQFDWGVDIEGHADPSTAAEICVEALDPYERALLKGKTPRYASLIFSAKESFYKAAAPQVGRVLGYDAIRLCSAPEPDTLRFQLTDDLSPELSAGEKITIAYRQFTRFTLTWTALYRSSVKATVNCASAL